MLSRIPILVALAALSLGLGCQSTTTEQSGAVDVLDDFEKDFFVAFGDPASWKVEDGVFQCNGTPNGYICSRKSYSNYVLTLEFRFPEQAGNSGVFHYISGEHKVWPACVEVQGLYQRLAQIFPLGGAEGPRSDGDEEARTRARKPHTEWNHLKITSQDGVIGAKLNGVFIGESGPYPVRQGPIGLQSEGAPVHFRNIEIREL